MTMTSRRHKQICFNKSSTVLSKLQWKLISRNKITDYHYFRVSLLVFKIQLFEWLKHFFRIRSTWSAISKGETESTSDSTSSHIPNIISSNHFPTDKKIQDFLWKLDWSSADPFKSFAHWQENWGHFVEIGSELSRFIFQRKY